MDWLFLMFLDIGLVNDDIEGNANGWQRLTCVRILLIMKGG